MRGDTRFWLMAFGLVAGLPLLNAGLLGACGKAEVPAPPPPPPSASASAALAPSSSAAPAPSASAAPVPPADSAGAEPSAAPAAKLPSAVFHPIDPGDWHFLAGRWIDAKLGDAIPGGPRGGSVVAGAARVEFVKGKPHSKTPWNVTFWLPRPAHMEAKTISGGCGLYESGKAFCRGYGLEGTKPFETHLGLQMTADHAELYVVLEGLGDAFLVRP
jgi:hypothetical protein